MVSIWSAYKENKPKESKNYLCVILLPDFKGGDYSIEQAVLKYDVDTDSFDCDGCMAVLFWTECPKLPSCLFISEVLYGTKME